MGARDDDLLYYYDRELSFLRQMGAEFAERYPKIASRLLLEPNKCEDPHVERLLEAFAFLAARVHLKIDDDFPEISESFLNVVFPHYIRPIPSMSVVEFRLDPDQGKLTTGLRIPRESMLYSRPVGGVPCKFRTCYETTIWPLSVAAAQWQSPDRIRPPVRASDAVGALRLDLRCLPDVAFDKLELDTLRLYLNGESGLISTLYELLCNNCVGILARDLSQGAKHKTLTLPASSLRPVGFAEDEGMLPYPRHSFLGYRLLQEYFSFPEKFQFLDLSGFAELRAAGFGQSAEIIFLISSFERAERRPMLETGVSERTIRLGCAPVINLFPQTSEPVLLDQRKHEYQIVPDARRRRTTEIFSIDDVVGIRPGSSEAIRFEPLYSHRHRANGTERRTFWYAKRRPTGWRSNGSTEVFLSFVDLSGRTVYPDLDAVTARLTCLNGDLPARLPFGDESGDFELQGGSQLRKIVALVKPTDVVQPPLGSPQLWRLISQLSLNYLSLVEDGLSALQEILRLHNFANTMAGERQIQGIVGVRSGPSYARVVADHGLSFARGRRVEVDFDEEGFTGGGVYLFASVLERFLGLYASMNSFSVLVARTRQRNEVLRAWPPRAGWKILL
jgi:type VI secretion system protein ImpG